MAKVTIGGKVIFDNTPKEETKKKESKKDSKVKEK